jgi:serine/threonine protein kinase
MKEHETSQRQHPLLFDHYEVIRVLGHGAMGLVYLSRDVRIGRLAALKTMKTEKLPIQDDEALAEFMARFKREAEVCGSLVHQNIVTLYEVGYSNRQIQYLAMEYVEGESLSSLLQRRKRLEIDLAAQITLDVLRGLEYAHERQIIHRDIKPANVLVGRDAHAKIGDFGVARSVREGISHRTRAGHLLGTPYYMAPEHIAGKEVDRRTDLFSVGVMFFEMLSGRRPFEGDSIMDVLYDVVNSPTPSLRSLAPDLPRWVEIYVSRLLEKKPSNRFISAAAAAAELERLLGVHREATGTSERVRPLSDLVKRELSADLTPTTPIISSRAYWRQIGEKRIDRRLAVALLVGIVLLLGAPVAWIASRVDENPPVAIDLQQQHDLERRKRMLEDARLLLDAGAYEQALERYERVLAEFPDSRSAIEGREEALRGRTAVNGER